MAKGTAERWAGPTHDAAPLQAVRMLVSIAFPVTAVATMVLVVTGVAPASALVAVLVPTALVVCMIDTVSPDPERWFVFGNRAFLSRLRGVEGRPLEHVFFADASESSTIDVGDIPRSSAVVIESAYFAPLKALAPGLLDRSHSVLVTDCHEFMARNPLRPLIPPASRFAKRMLDLVVSSALLVLLSPVFVLVALVVRADSEGPAFFTQTRIGMNGKRFRLYKFRTMVVDNNDAEHQEYVAALVKGEAQRNGDMFKLVDDPRVTRVGARLRRYSLDELPQLWNVLRGDMSLVGPRPDIERTVVLYDAHAWGRLRVKPGMTGLWQVSGRSELNFREMMDLDAAYANSWSFGLDLKILLQTPKVVLSARGAA
jgi:lipopolysaccharide/colanic/teichoic acid biosynthesis glycosyltransferase